MGVLKKVRELFEAIREMDFDTEDPQLEDFVSRCMVRYSTWFGPVTDPQCKMQVVLSHRTACGWDPVLGGYDIFIDKGLKTSEERLAAVAHEVFHRVVWNSWLKYQLHLNEMLAFLTTQELLRFEGFQHYAENLENASIESDEILDPRALSEARPIRRFLERTEYPEGFYPSVEVMGLKVRALVGWPELCRLVRSSGPLVWLQGLPADQRRSVAKVMGLDHPD